MSIEITFDLVCPFAYTGLKRIENNLNNIKEFKKFNLFPLQLKPEIPEEGVKQLPTSELDDTVKETRKRLKKMVSQVGLDIDYDKQKRIPNTYLAHSAVQAFQDPLLKLKFANALFLAHFTQGLFIADLEVIMNIAKEKELDTELIRSYIQSDQLEKDWIFFRNRLVEKHIKSVPHLFYSSYDLAKMPNDEVFSIFTSY